MLNSKFKWVATFMTKEGAEHYERLNKAIGYDIRIIKNKSPFSGSEEYVVYQTREKAR